MIGDTLDSITNMRKQFFATLFLALGLLWAIGAWAQTQTPPTPQFFFTGFIQEATLDTTGAICTPAAQVNAAGVPIDVSRLHGGTVTVNGIRMIVPCNTLLQLPAATKMWADLFDPLVAAPVGSNVGSPLPVQAVGQTRLALADSPMPFPSFAVSVNGNVVGKNDGTIPGLAAGTDKYIVGLIVPIEQQVLNGSSGLVSFIDYVSGSFRVGGLVGDANCTQGGVPGGGLLCSGALVQFNDPIANAGPGGTSGRWGLTHSPDPRFSGDDANTTITTSTGFPLCIPRVAPPAIDTECPIGNRPLNGDARFPVDPFIAAGQPVKMFNMPCPAGTPVASCPVGQPAAVSGYPDPTKQVPLMVGDQVNYIGTIFKIDPLATVTDPVTLATIPDNTAANSYMSAHTVEDVLGIFTAPGVPPAYVRIEDMLIGTNGAAVQGILQEASTRMTVVGFTSDPTRLVDIYAQDVNPCSGQVSLRLLATEDPATDAIVGRFVHRVLGGTFMPPTRNYTIRSRTQQVDPVTGLRVPQIVANGIVAGEFSLPLFEYIFPENHRLGDPFLPNNYQDMPFLAFGSGPVDGFGSGTAVLGQLSPWPGATAPAPVTCAAGGGTTPIVLIDPAIISVGLGAAVTLTGAVNFDPLDDPASHTASWAGPVAGTPGGTVTAPTYTFIAPSTAGPLNFTLTATDNFGSGTGTVTVNVLAASDIVQIPAGLATWTTQRGKIGPFGKLGVSATSSAAPAAILTLLEKPVEDATHPPSCPLTAPVAGGVCNWGTGSFNKVTNTYAWVEDKGAPQPASLTVTSDHGGTATVSCSIAKVKTTNVGGVSGTFLSVTCP